MNESWIEAQNSADAHLALAASDTLWARVQALRLVQIVFIVAVPVVVSALAIARPSVETLAAYVGVVMLVLDAIAINPTIVGIRREAAQIQDRFDSIALSLPRVAIRRDGDSDVSRIADLAKKQPRKRIYRNYDWYTTALGILPVALGRIACMRESVSWDASVRTTWAWIALLAALLPTAALITWAVLTGRKSDVFLLQVVAPLAPAFVWTVREAIEQFTSARTYAALRQRLRDLWYAGLSEGLTDGDLTETTSQIAWAFIEFRAATSPVPHLIYDVFRSDRAANALDTATILIREYETRKH